MGGAGEFAYAIGLIATDGCLSGDKRHIDFTSKDAELVKIFKRCLGINNKIGRKSREKEKLKKYYKVQFGDRNFYDFLVSIGLTPAKSKTLGSLSVPDTYFADFLIGCIDGDGSIGVFWHPESRHPQLRVKLASASPRFLCWVKHQVYRNVMIKRGWIERVTRAHRLVYAKEDAIVLLHYMYDNAGKNFLVRKHRIARPFLRM